MKYYFVTVLILMLTIISLPPLYADNSKADANSSFGLGGSYVYYDVQKKRGENDWDSSMGYGGGFVFERMWGNRLGIHSGVWLNRFTLNMIQKQTDSAGNESLIDMKINNFSVNIPLYFILSFNARVVSLNLLLGPSFMYIWKSEAIANDSVDGEMKADVLRFLGTFQAGLGAGINLKFRIGTFTDFYVGVIAEYYYTKLIKEDPKDFSNLYDGRIISGFLFRTDVFPIANNKE